MTDGDFEIFTKNLGDVIDMPYDEFEIRIRENAIPVGILQNMRFLFIASYNNLIARKDALLDKISKGEISLEENKEVIIGIYNEMQKIEDKSLFLVKRISELLDI